MKKILISIIFATIYYYAIAQGPVNSFDQYASVDTFREEPNLPKEVVKADLITDPIKNLVDNDWNTYSVVKIGTQVWMAENLKTTKFNDGTAIPVITDNKIWSKLLSPGFCWYNNDAKTYKNKYGVLYNGYTVSTGKLCPIGWHIPSEADWLTLTKYCGENLAGGILKETGNWMSPNTGATNAKGFTALPGGSRGNLGSFMDKGIRGHWWSSTEINNLDVWNRTMSFSNSSVTGSSDHKQSGLSVRCMKD